MSMTLKARKVLVLAALVIASGMTTLLTAASQDDQVKKGQAVYAAQKCSVCHIIAGKGNKANPLDGIGAKLKADEIKEWITHPVDAAKKANSTKKPPMPAKYGKLPAADLDALVAYMASLK